MKNFFIFLLSPPTGCRQRRQEIRASEPDGRGHPEGRLGMEPVPEGTDLPEDRSTTCMVSILATTFIETAPKISTVFIFVKRCNFLEWSTY